MAKVIGKANGKFFGKASGIFRILFMKIKEIRRKGR